MAKQRTPEAAVDEFLRSPTARTTRGGQPCQTCALANRADIERAGKHFNAQRASRATTVGWRSFVRHVLAKEPFSYPLGWRSLVNHLENHCDVEVS